MPTRQAQSQRLVRILSRQKQIGFGREYSPAILATRAEAPSCSRACILRAQKVGRDMHLLSSAEKAAAILALFLPQTWDVHEQHMLSPTPSEHPLQGSPRAIGLQLPRIEGTVAVAERLGKLKMHAKFYSEKMAKWVPDVYVGDLLLYCIDAQGPYCVNWTVKDSDDGFEQPIVISHRIPNRDKAVARAKFRHELEAVYFSDAGIRTQRIMLSGLNRELTRNLEVLFAYHARVTDIHPDITTELVSHFAAAVGSDQTCYSVCLVLAQKLSLADYIVKDALYKAIWSRKIQVDLFSYLAIDRPLRPQERDPADVYASWVGR